MFVIPNPLQLDIDDLGWFCGDDDRKSHGASRSGMPRRHCAQDYIAINALGEALDMKIRCAFVLGEWDPDNRLAGMPHLSKYDGRWDNAAYLDAEQARRCAEVINASPYIDFVLHGISHGYYIQDSDNVDISDYYYYRGGELFMVPEAEVRGRLDAFFDLMKHYGIKKEVTGFIPPSGAYRLNELSHILKDYGIRYIAVPYRDVIGEKPEICGVEDCGAIVMDRCNNFIPWDEADSDLSALPEKGWESPGIFGAHWPNFLHPDPERNGETIARWIKYIKACGENFGTVLSKDIEFAASQLMYLRYAKCEVSDRCVEIDVSAVPVKGEFYISTTNVPSGCVGAECVLYEEHSGFATYKITPHENKITITM